MRELLVTQKDLDAEEAAALEDVPDDGSTARKDSAYQTPLLSLCGPYFVLVPSDAYDRLDEVASQTFDLVEELKQVRLPVRSVAAWMANSIHFRAGRASTAGTLPAGQDRDGRNQVIEVVRLPLYTSSVALFVIHVDCDTIMITASMAWRGRRQRNDISNKLVQQPHLQISR